MTRRAHRLAYLQDSSGTRDHPRSTTAQGIVAGLQSKEGGMQKVMDRFAASMVGGIRRELKIKSPSQVFHELGRHTGTGFEHGIKSKYAAVNAAVSNMVNIPSMAGGRGGVAGGGFTLGPDSIRVYVGDRQITDIVRVEVGHNNRQLAHALTTQRAQY